MIEFQIGSSQQILRFSDVVLTHFQRYRQTRCWHSEAGGQLFARYAHHLVEIVEATGPRPTDRRTRYSYVPDRCAEQREIQNRHLVDLHFIGDWHTHAQRRPQLSPTDRKNIDDCFRRSQHSLNAFVLVIVGKEELPAGFEVSLHDGGAVHFLTPVRWG